MFLHGVPIHKWIDSDNTMTRYFNLILGKKECEEYKSSSEEMAKREKLSLVQGGI